MFLPSCPHSISSNRLFIMVTSVRVRVRDRVRATFCPHSVSVSILSLLTGEFPVDGSSHFVSLVETKCFTPGNKMFYCLNQVINCIDSASYLYRMIYHFMRFRQLRNLQFIQHLIQYGFGKCIFPVLILLTPNVIRLFQIDNLYFCAIIHKQVYQLCPHLTGNVCCIPNKILPFAKNVRASSFAVCTTHPFADLSVGLNLCFRRMASRLTTGISMPEDWI